MNKQFIVGFTTIFLFFIGGGFALYTWTSNDVAKIDQVSKERWTLEDPSNTKQVQQRRAFLNTLKKMCPDKELMNCSSMNNAQLQSLYKVTPSDVERLRAQVNKPWVQMQKANNNMGFLIF